MNLDEALKPVIKSKEDLDDFLAKYMVPPPPLVLPSRSQSLLPPPITAKSSPSTPRALNFDIPAPLSSKKSPLAEQQEDWPDVDTFATMSTITPKTFKVKSTQNVQAALADTPDEPLPPLPLYNLAQSSYVTASADQGLLNSLSMPDVKEDDSVEVCGNDGVVTIVKGIKDESTAAQIIQLWLNMQHGELKPSDYGLIQPTHSSKYLDNNATYGTFKSNAGQLVVRKLTPALFDVTVSFTSGGEVVVPVDLFSSVNTVLDQVVHQVDSSGTDDQKQFISEAEDALLGLWRLPLDAGDIEPRYLSNEETPFTPLDHNTRYMLKVRETDEGELKEQMALFRVYLADKKFRVLQAPKSISKADFWQEFRNSLKLPAESGSQWSLVFADEKGIKKQPVDGSLTMWKNLLAKSDLQIRLILTQQQKKLFVPVTFHDLEKAMFELLANVTVDDLAGLLLEKLASLDEGSLQNLSEYSSYSTVTESLSSFALSSNVNINNSEQTQVEPVMREKRNSYDQAVKLAQALGINNEADVNFLKDKIKDRVRKSSQIMQFGFAQDSSKALTQASSVSEEEPDNTSRQKKRSAKLQSMLGLNDEKDLVRFLVEVKSEQTDKSKAKVARLLGIDDKLTGTRKPVGFAGMITKAENPSKNVIVQPDVRKSSVDSAKSQRSSARQPVVHVPKTNKPQLVNGVFSAKIYLLNQTYKSLLLNKEATVTEVISTLIERLNIKNGAEKYNLVEDRKNLERLMLKEEKIFDVMNKWEGQEVIVFKKAKANVRASVDSLATGSIKEKELDVVKAAQLNRRAAKIANILGMNEKKDSFAGDNPDMQNIVKILNSASTKNELTQNMVVEKIQKEGWLLKEYSNGDTKQKDITCWCYLKNGVLYVTIKSNIKKSEVLAKLTITNYSVSNNVQRRNCIDITSKVDASETYSFFTDSVSSCESWIRALQEAQKAQTSKTSTTQSVRIGSQYQSKISLNDFEIHKVLGRGKFGKVLLCKQKSSGKVYAIKVIKKSTIKDSKELASSRNESQILRVIRHPFIVGLHYAFQTADRLHLVMEYVNGGELYFHISTFGRFSEERASFYAAEICLALQCLHGKEIVYRDLKLENILLDNDGHVKITDFGLSKRQSEVEEDSDVISGTFEYLSPEVIGGMTNSYAADWWAYGLVTFEMLCGFHPFYHEDREELCHRIMYMKVEYPSFLSLEAKDFISKLLNRDPEKRLGCGSATEQEINKHSFFHNIDFDALFRKEIEPPFKPDVTSDLDVSFFDDEFTDQPTTLTPTDNNSFIDDKQSAFVGFSYNQDDSAIIRQSLRK